METDTCITTMYLQNYFFLLKNLKNNNESLSWFGEVCTRHVEELRLRHISITVT